jgi:branched-chain amino acid transport system ATP-binding protein
LLEAKNLIAGYGDIDVLMGVDITIEEGQIVSILGSNSAGKTTLINTISGLIKLKAGRVSFRSCDISYLPPHKIVELGLVQVPEGRKLFPQMTVLEHLLVGSSNSKFKDNRDRNLKKVFGIFPILEERREQVASTLSGGEQQMLAIARALMAQPKLLMLDEPSFGLAPLATKELFGVISLLNKEQGMTVLLVEQNLKMALNFSDFGYVIENGKITLKGTSQELLDNEETKRAYLGA